MTLASIDMFDLFIEGIRLPFSYFVSTDKRLHFIYLLTSIALAFWVFKRDKHKTTFYKYLFSKKIWFSNSAMIDYQLIFINALVKVFMIGPFLIYGLYIAFWVNEYMENFFGLSESSLSSVETLFYYTLCLTIISDLFTYLIHLIMHRVPFLWAFHKTHHSATKLTPITQYRIHPIELLINNLKGIVVFGVLTGMFDYLSQHQISKLTFIGVNVFSFIFLSMGSNLRHSHVKFKYWDWLEHLFISPFQHQIHHSDKPQHYNKNFGAKLALWDSLFGTLVRSKDVKTLSFGLGEKDNNNYGSLFSNIFYPVKYVAWVFYNKIYKLFKLIN